MDLRAYINVFILAVIVLSVVYLVYQVIHLIRGYSFCLVSGVSMFPTLKNGQIVLEHKLKKSDLIYEGDIVIANLPQKDYLVIKRVKGIIEVNGIKYYWLEGDNKDHSVDSRMYGHVKEDYIRGRVIKVWKKQWN